MKKTGFASIFAALLFLFLAVPLAAETRVIRTEYFDVIHTGESAETASLIASAADGFADEICLLLDTSMRERIPVFINGDQKDLNAYFTPSAYNRIVIYDALPVEGSLACFRDSILKVFYHELVHLVSLNIRTPFWQGVSNVFGDLVSINDAITMTPSFIEGVTVSFESRDGEGRVNDPLVTHTLAQAKIDGKFLSFKDSAGARDVYPSGRVPYYYGGAFSFWLQKTYGMEKYAELWKRGGGFSFFKSSIWGRFRQVYGLPLEEAWNMFRDSIPVPQDVRTNDDVLSGADEGILSSLASGPDGIVWNDVNAGKVFFRSNDGKVRPLFESDGNLTRLSLSDDGSLLLVSSFSPAQFSSSETVRVYDMKKRRFTGESYENLRDASFANGVDSVCGIETSGQKSFLVVLSRKGKGNEDAATDRKVLAEAGPGRNWSAFFSPVFAGNGMLALVGANGPDRDIVFADIGTGTLTQISLPEGTGYIRYLQSAETSKGRRLSFSWSSKDSLYRYGLYDPETGDLVLQGDNLSGGVFWPVADGSGTGVNYIASFSESDRLMHLALDGNMAAAVVSSPLISGSDGAAIPAPSTRPFPETPPATIGYNPVSWFRDGVFYPFVANMQTGYETWAWGPQINYITEDPTESVQVSLSSAFFADPLFAVWSLSTQWKTAPGTLGVMVRDDAMPAVSLHAPYRQLASRLSFERIDYPGSSGKTLTTSLTGNLRAYASGAPESSSIYDASFDARSAGGGAEFVYADIRAPKIPGRLFFPVKVTGFSLSANGYGGIVLPDGDATNLVQGQLAAYLPYIPLSLKLSAARADGLVFTPGSTVYEAYCAREYVWDETRYCPTFPEYANTVYGAEQTEFLVAGKAEITPLNIEIQHGVPFLAIYANRANLSTGYRAAVFNLLDGSPTYIDTLYLKGKVEASIIMGAMTNAVLFASAEYAYALRSGNWDFQPDFGAKISY